VVDTDGGGLFVVKFRGAGQGTKVLVAELIVGGLARALGLPAPELALVTVSPRFGRSEPDPEIQELLRKSHGTNVGLRYLEGAFNFDVGAAGDLVTPELAALIVWLDAFTTNPDRTARNPNMLIWERQPWLIDHGAALYAHHDWDSVDEARTRTPFQLIRSHVLLPRSADLMEADRLAVERLSEEAIRAAVSVVPDSLFGDARGAGGDFATPTEARERYVQYLTTRLREPRAFVEEAVKAQTQLRLEPPIHLKARR
jgi:hypothetical protein